MDPRSGRSTNSFPSNVTGDGQSSGKPVEKAGYSIGSFLVDTLFRVHRELHCRVAGYMVPSHVATEVVDTTLKRIDLLECLLDGPTDKRTLEDEVPVSRSTVDRAVRELEVLELVEYCSEGYAITPVGEIVTGECADLLETVDVALELEEFVRWLPLSEFHLDLEALADAELLVPDPSNPYAMIDRHVQLVKETDHGRGMLPLTGLHAYEAAHENVVERGARTELVVEPDVAEVMLSDPAFEELTIEMLGTGRFDLSVYDGTIPYFVGVFDDETVQMGVDADGEPRALVETTEVDVVSWAHATIDEYAQQASEVSMERSHAPLTPGADE